MTELPDTSAVAVNIRPFEEADYPAIAAISTTVWPDFPTTVEEIADGDRRRDPIIKWARFIAEIDGQPVAVGGYGQDMFMYHPNKFSIDINVLPEFESRGVGSSIYDTIIEDIKRYDPILLRCHGREDLTRGLNFVKKRGFVEDMRDWESRLQLATFDPSKFADAKQRVADQGIVIKSLAELANDPDRASKLYELDWAITLDIPAPDALTKPTFEHFENHVLKSPNFLPEGWFIALDGEEYIGESALWKSQANSNLSVGATGVRREYRRRGIAMALKMHAIEYAKSIGCPEMKTWNEQNNVGMLSINVALGFVRQPAWISFAKTIDAA